MLKVLFDNSIFLHQKNGGISKYITKLNDELKNFKIKSKIFSPISINEYLDNNKKNNTYFVKFFNIPRFCRKIFFTINNLATFFYIKINKPDIIHFSYYNHHLLKYIKIPYVLTVYDLIHEKYKFKFPQKQFEKKRILEGAKHIFCISNKTKNDLCKFYKLDKNKLSVVYLGIDKIKKKELIKNKKNFILFVGDRSNYKNFKNLAYAYSKSDYLKNHYKILCFGGGNFSNAENKFFDKLKIKKKIILRQGSDKKLQSAYREASLFVTVSLEEGFGFTPLEAMSMSCPTMCSNIKIFKETLKNGCLFVNPKNTNEIKKGIEKILKSKKLQDILIKKGQNRVKVFTWSNCALETSKIYYKIIKK